MKPSVAVLSLLLAVGGSISAHEKTVPPARANPAHDPALVPVHGVVDAFGRALKAADMATVTRLLDENVLILESGGAERSRAEYLDHHAGADARFLATATVTPIRRHGRIQGDTAWIGSESEIRSGDGATAKVLLSTETMVLERRDGNWRIVHIHWSSRPKKATP